MKRKLVGAEELPSLLTDMAERRSGLVGEEAHRMNRMIPLQETAEGVGVPLQGAKARHAHSATLLKCE
jgi:hypothetical protein